jgi:hypothetical protein
MTEYGHAVRCELFERRLNGDSLESLQRIRENAEDLLRARAIRAVAQAGEGIVSGSAAREAAIKQSAVVNAVLKAFIEIGERCRCGCNRPELECSCPCGCRECTSRCARGIGAVSSAGRDRLRYCQFCDPLSRREITDNVSACGACQEIYRALWDRAHLCRPGDRAQLLKVCEELMKYARIADRNVFTSAESGENFGGSDAC